MSIDPKITFWFGVWTSIMLMVASGAINFEGALPAAYVPMITKWCSILGTINSAILTAMSGYSSTKAGPMTSGPASITPTVVKVLLVAFALSVLFLGSPASAQTQRLKLAVDPLGLNNRTPSGGGPLEDIIGALDAKLLPDLQYALKLAQASGSKVTAPCYQAWIDIINVRQKAVQDDKGQDMPMPDPAIVTKFEKLVELRNSLQPDSEFMIKCSPVASMVKKDIIGFIGIVLSGGAGLATLVPGL